MAAQGLLFFCTSDHPMSSPVVRVRGWNADGKPMDFISIVRAHTGVDLPTAKALLDRLQAGATIDLKPLALDHPRRVGERLLGARAVREAELTAGGQPAQAIVLSAPAPVFGCPSCRRTLKHRSECEGCGWLRFPGNRGRWNKTGPCPRCGFSYRYDGSSCSHCGHGSTEQPSLMITAAEGAG